MSKKQIVVKLSSKDNYNLTAIDGDDIAYISLDQEDKTKMLRTDIEWQLKALKFVPDNTMYDFLYFALALYTIDQTVSRQEHGFQGWSRYLIIYFPVNDKKIWDGIKNDLENYLGFLSGDKWSFEFRQNKKIRATQRQLDPNPDKITQVSLLSGGLDSFIGAIDLLSSGQKPYFISHYKTGIESSTQDKVLGALKVKYPKTGFKTHKFYVQPNQRNKTEKENTSRARSFLFIALGLVTANSLGDNIDLILPENGLISLNIPLTKTRLSSHSTRTTHPYFVNGLNKILKKLRISNSIINPYGFRTKGEMMLECKDKVFLLRNVAETKSCSHPEQSRYSKLPPGLNCGYCVPCLIRQAAEYKAGKIKTVYAIGDIRKSIPSQRAQKGADYRAFKIGLEKLNAITQPHSLALHINKSGQIPYTTQKELENYISVYKRGMEEVKEFLES